MKRTLGGLLLLCGAAFAPACSCSDGDTSSGTASGGASGTGTTAPNGTGSNAGGSGSTEATLVTVGSGGNGQGGAGTGAASGTGGEGGTCADVTINFEPIIPTVLLLIDQSGSMTEGFGGSNRWDELYDALMDPIDGVVIGLEDQVRFGLALYTGEDDQCPMLIEQTIALGNHAAIDAVYAPQGPEGETPTGDSIDAVLPALLAYPEEGPKFIILATDGEPDTCEQPNPQNGQGEAIAAAQSASAADVGLFVISVGNDVSDAHLQDMANAGAGLPLDTPDDAPFWKALDPAGLVAAFDTIINGVRSCVLTVDGEIDPENACEGEVRIDGVVIPCNDPNGWVVNSPTEIELQGAACDLIQNGVHTVDATFPCDVAETSGTGGSASTSSIPN